jgi:hypothetical protein
MCLLDLAEAAFVEAFPQMENTTGGLSSTDLTAIRRPGRASP